MYTIVNMYTLFIIIKYITIKWMLYHVISVYLLIFFFLILYNNQAILIQRDIKRWNNGINLYCLDIISSLLLLNYINKKLPTLSLILLLYSYLNKVLGGMYTPIILFKKLIQCLYIFIRNQMPDYTILQERQKPKHLRPRLTGCKHCR